MASSEKVLHSGQLQYKKSSLSIFHPYVGILLDLETSSFMLELYAVEKCINKVYPFDAAPTVSIEFQAREILAVDRDRNKFGMGSNFQFKVVATTNRYSFSTKSEEECAQWVRSFMKLLKLVRPCNSRIARPPTPGKPYDFCVKVIPTKMGDNLKLGSGIYTMRIAAANVSLYAFSGMMHTKFNYSFGQLTKVTSQHIGTHNTNALSSCDHSHPGGTDILIMEIHDSKLGKGGCAFSTNSAAEIASIINHRHRSKTEGRPLPPVPELLEDQPSQKLKMNTLSVTSLQVDLPGMTPSRSFNDLLSIFENESSKCDEVKYEPVPMPVQPDMDRLLTKRQSAPLNLLNFPPAPKPTASSPSNPPLHVSPKPTWLKQRPLPRIDSDEESSYVYATIANEYESIPPRRSYSTSNKSLEALDCGYLTIAQTQNTNVK